MIIVNVDFRSSSSKLENETTEFIQSKNEKFPFFANYFWWKLTKTCFIFTLHNEQTQKSVFDCFRWKLDSFRIFKSQVPGTEILKMELILQGVENHHDTWYGSGNELFGAVKCCRRSIEVKCRVTDRALTWGWRRYGWTGFDY